MRIAIIGTRGIPNFYGGFEQFAEFVSIGLVNKGHDVTVYNSHTHPFKEKVFKGVNIIHCYDLEDKIGTAGQFFYDLNCIIDSRKRNFDVIIQLGYTSSSIWSRVFPKKAVLTTNMDGLEWKRTKYSSIVQRFLLYAESLAIKHSDYLISDSIGIQNYIEEKYSKKSTYIPYGADVFENSKESLLSQYNIAPNDYNLLIARLEPENSIEIILDGVLRSSSSRPFLVIGKYESKYGEYLKNKYSADKRVQFLGGIYNQEILNNLRFFSNLYFHGHTVGGTNPSLLEAMASSALICAHENIFNRAILNGSAFYFSNSADVALFLESKCKIDHQKFILDNLDKIKSLYTWDRIINQYEQHLIQITS
jgi:hypothetical protein